MKIAQILKKAVPVTIKDKIKIMNFKRKFHYKKSGRKNTKCVVLFLVSRTNIFSSVQSIFEAADQHDEFDAYLIALPNRANDKTNIDNSDVLDFCKKITEEKTVSCFDDNGQFFDLQTLRPDYIFLGIPYDEEYPEPYRFDKLASFSKLCFVPYGYLFIGGVVLETVENLSLLAHISYLFADGPVTYRYCKKQLSLTEKFNGQKVYALGFPRFDQFTMDDIEENGKKIRKLIYCPRWTTPGSELHGHEPSSFMLFKDAILDYADRHREFEIVIRPHPILFYRFVQCGLITEDELHRYRERVDSLSNVTIDETPDYRDAMLRADVMITDYSSTIAEFLLTGRPIIYFGTDKNVSNEHKPLFEDVYTVKSWAELQNVLDELQKGNDPKRLARISDVKRILKPNNYKAGELIVNKLYHDWKR